MLSYEDEADGLQRLSPNTCPHCLAEDEVMQTTIDGEEMCRGCAKW